MKTTSFNNGRSNSSSLFRRGIGGVSFFFLLFLLLFASCDDLEDNRRGLGIPPMTWAFMEANSISWSMYRAR